MLPNHSPMVIAEQFGTLDALYPGRIDLGLGRAPGSDQLAARALRLGPDRSDDFPREVMQLQAFLAPEQPGQALRAFPGAGSEVPIWILGSSLFGAQLAAALGLPYAFASHFAPDALMAALQTYQADFQPSDAARRALRHDRPQRRGGRHRRRGRPAVHHDPAGVHQPPPWHARALPGTRSTTSTPTGRRPSASRPRTC